MDIHLVDSDNFSVEDVVKAHMADLAVEKKFHVTQHKYWVNVEKKTIFCLMEGPDRESCNAVHKESHGLTACNIIEVSDDEYNLYLGIGEKNEADLAQRPSGDIDEGYRTILLINHFDLTGKYDVLIKDQLALIEENKGTIILEPNEDIMVSFISAANAIHCAQTLRDLLRTSSDRFEFRIGLVTGSPVDETGTKLFEETKNILNHLCLVGLNGIISIDEATLFIAAKEGLTYHPDNRAFKVFRTEDFTFLNLVIFKIIENLSDTGFNSETLDKSLGLSKSQAYRKIKSLTGLATHEMIQEIRLRYALSALKYSDDTVAEIGYKHGFSSPTYFSRAFRKRFGLSPTSYTHHLTPHH